MHHDLERISEWWRQTRTKKDLKWIQTKEGRCQSIQVGWAAKPRPSLTAERGKLLDKKPKVSKTKKEKR